MIQKVRGIVLHHLNYGDTSIIVHLYTDLYGRISVMVKGARGQRKNRKISLYHPLALLEIDLNYKENRDLQQIREAKPILPLQGIMSDPVKNAVSLFLAETFYRTIRENEANQSLFEYLSNTIQIFDLIEDGVAIYHLYVLVQLTRFLGFRPQPPNDDNEYWFELETGAFSLVRPIRENKLNPKLTSHLIRLLRTNADKIAEIKIPRKERNELIEQLLYYYRLQMDGMGEIKSFAILKAVFE